MNRWLFTPDQLEHTPSIEYGGMTVQQEIRERHIAAAWIRKIGKKLHESCQRPSSLSINTAMVFMHRFYMFHSFQKYPALTMAPCALFLAAKVEETPLKLEYVIKTVHMLTTDPNSNDKLEVNDKEYEKMQQEIIANENLLLQTLGFDLVIAHPHTSIITCAEFAGVPESLTKLAYNLATNSLHFSTMCLTYDPSTVACICIQLASKRIALDIGQSIEGKYWWSYLDPTLDMDKISKISKDYIEIIERHKQQFNRWMTHHTSASGGNKRIKLDH